MAMAAGSPEGWASLASYGVFPMSKNGDVRLAVRKMYKLYINGAFARSESGRSDPVGGDNVAHASRKDVRDAVTAARAGHVKWAAQAPALRGLVLYRLAEMMEGRAAELAAQLVAGGSVTEAAAADEVAAAIDRTIWYAGWCDKYLALASTRNPVAGPHFNFSTAEPTGVVGILAPDEPQQPDRGAVNGVGGARRFPVRLFPGFSPPRPAFSHAWRPSP